MAGEPAGDRRCTSMTACPFLQCRMPPLQWSKKYPRSLMNTEGGPAVLFYSIWIAFSVESLVARPRASGGLALRGEFSFLVLLGRRLMRFLHRHGLVAALFSVALMSTAA